ncbi:GntR family transcriptional regulator [Frigidibacter sp. ROC022]|uniref:GntR family transcriptional regulator n=1 Tax=Frigidibacter sp. ROC022 TaxID=2971796 RepID=UPI00215AC12E|nr:GntR family transcriptional regulator [Frigidibacter sp. ROC022]
MIPESTIPPLRERALADRVADHIVEAIAGQKLAPGQKLVETELAESLGVSRVPVREAMRILASQGIVVPKPRRGMHVANFDKAWGVQLHDARVAVERLAARLVAEKLKTDPHPLELLSDRILEIEHEAHHPRNGWYGIHRADTAFHQTVFDIAGSPLLSTLWSAIQRHVLIMFAIETDRDDNYERIIPEHHRYVEVLQSGDLDLLDAEIETHVAGARMYRKLSEK